MTEHALLRPEGGPRSTELGGVGGNLPIRARQQRTGGPVGEWKTRTARPEKRQEVGTRLRVANHRPLRTAGGSAALVGTLGGL